jgi:hypothetical protein
MSNIDRFTEARGYVTLAQNNATTDYLRLAYCQALSIKATQKINSYAVIVDKETMKQVTPLHKKVFDYVIELPNDYAEDDEWKMRNEWQTWWLTPFKETMKVESDILFTTNIDHWWTGLGQREVTLTNHVRNYEGNVATSRAYRQLFDDNLLPDVYSGLMYFRYGRVSMMFFTLAKTIFENWHVFRNRILFNCRDALPTTDVVFAIVTKIIGEEECTNPALSYPTFTHMKSDMQGWASNVEFNSALYSQFDKSDVTLGFTKQMHPLHYHDKAFITDKIIAHYEQYTKLAR